MAASQGNLEICNTIKRIDSTMKSCEKKDDDVDFVPAQAKILLNALSKTGLAKDTKLELAKMARKVWERWKVDLDDLEFAVIERVLAKMARRKYIWRA